jgi:flagellar hook protein FlgE
MSFQTGLSGLNNAARSLDVIGNNVANASVVGFKGSRAQFADVFATSVAGASQIGIGSKVAAVAQDFSQGTITVSNNPLDLAIAGNGFFRVLQQGAAVYSRNGQFQLDHQGYIVNSQGHNLTGFPADSAGNIVQSAPVPLRISTADVPPTPTGEFNAVFNLDARSPAITVAFDPTNPASYTSSTSGTVYDSLGNPHVLTLFFQRTATPGQWNTFGTVNGAPVPNVTGLTTLQFDSSGQLQSPMPLAISMPITGGGASPLSMALDVTGSTQFGAPFGVTALHQNGFTSGRLAGFNISDQGIIVGRYSNGQTRTLGQVVLASFVNPQGLRPLGDGVFEESASSGLPVVGTPRSGNLGALQSSALEESNVDLTEQLVAMITAQRIYQANAQTIKTQDQVLQTLVNLR